MSPLCLAAATVCPDHLHGRAERLWPSAKTKNNERRSATGSKRFRQRRRLELDQCRLTHASDESAHAQLNRDSLTQFIYLVFRLSFRLSLFSLNRRCPPRWAACGHRARLRLVALRNPIGTLDHVRTATLAN